MKKMYKCYMRSQNIIATRQMNANNKMEQKINSIKDYTFGIKYDQSQRIIERSQNSHIYKWVNPDLVLNNQKINHPKICRKGPFNRNYYGPGNSKSGPPMHNHKYLVQNIERCYGNRGHLKWVNPDCCSNKRKIEKHQQDQAQILYINGPQTLEKCSDSHGDLKWINPNYDSKQSKRFLGTKI